MADPAESTATIRRLTGVPAGIFSDEDVAAFLADNETDDGYNIAATCADILEAWATRAAAAVDFTADGASVSQSDQAPALREAARLWRRKSGLSVGTIARTDERR